MSEKDETAIYCDQCNPEHNHCDGIGHFDGPRDAAKNAGWTRGEDGGDVCPDCSDDLIPF